MPKLIVGRDRIIEEDEVVSSGRAYDGRGVPEYATLDTTRRFDGRPWITRPLQTILRCANNFPASCSSMEREPIRIEHATADIIMDAVEVRRDDLRDHIGTMIARIRCNEPLVAAHTIAKVGGVVPIAHLHDERNGFGEPILLDDRADRGRVLRVAARGADVRHVHWHEIRGMKLTPRVQFPWTANPSRLSQEQFAFGRAAMRDGDGRRHS